MADRLSDYVLDALDETIQRVRANPQNGKIAFVQVHDGILEKLVSAYREAALDIPPSVDGLDAGENGLPRPMAGAAAAAWQPIETAPKDGTRIDLWLGSYRRTDAWWGRPHHECGEAGRYCDCCPSYDGWCDDFGYISGEEGIEDDEPTHWMPRPLEPGASPAGDDPKALDAAARSSSTKAVEQEVERLRRIFRSVLTQADCLRHYARMDDAREYKILPTVGEIQAGHFEDLAIEAVPELQALLDEQRAKRAAKEAARAALSPSLPGKEEGRG